MNERIKELMVECYNPYGEFRYEKFAELIVRECVKVAKDGPWYDDDPSCDWRKPINFVCNEMKEHFGVEE